MFEKSISNRCPLERQNWAQKWNMRIRKKNLKNIIHMYSDTRVYLHDEYETFYSRENSLELSWPRAFTNDH